jgi:Ca2+-binding EF-hand superfamily protein
MIRLGFLALSAGLLLASSGDAADGNKKKGKRDPQAILKRLDSNNDGKLSKEEFSKIGKGDNATRADKRFGKLDANSDGSLSADELKKIGERKKKKNES